MEVWSKIGLDAYEISSLGRLRNGEKFLAVRVSKDGYHTVCLKGRSLRIHRLVALAFLPTSDPSLDVNHKDGNKLNNRLENLEWVTRAANNKHAVATGLAALGSKHPNAKLNEQQLAQIHSLLSSGESQRTIGKQFGISQSLVSRINRLKVWKHFRAA